MRKVEGFQRRPSRKYRFEVIRPLLNRHESNPTAPSPEALMPCAVRGVDVGVEVSAMFAAIADHLCPFLFDRHKISMIQKGLEKVSNGTLLGHKHGGEGIRPR